MSLLKIADVPAPSVEPGATVLQAVQKMADEGVGGVAVVERGQLRGIFTERDVMLRVVLRGLDPTRALIRDLMTTAPKTIGQETTTEEALNFMLEHHIRHVPIVNRDGQLLGMISLRGLLEHMVEDLRHELHSLDQFLSNDGPGG